MKIWFTLLLVAIVLVVFRVASQKPMFWCDQRWAGISLNNGGYRSWSVTFRPVVVLHNDPPSRAFLLPRFCHVDLRGKSESFDYFLTNGPMRWGPLPSTANPTP